MLGSYFFNKKRSRTAIGYCTIFLSLLNIVISNKPVRANQLEHQNNLVSSDRNKNIATSSFHVYKNPQKLDLAISTDLEGCYNFVFYDNCDFISVNYQKLNSINTETLSLLKEAIKYTHEGHTRLAKIVIERVIELSEKNNDPILLIRSKEVLGNIHFINGDYQNAIAAYQKSLNLAISANYNLAVTIAWNNLTNTWNIIERDYQSQASRIQNNPSEVSRLEKLAALAHLSSLNAASQALETSKNKISTSGVRAWINWHRVNSSLEPQDANIPLSVLSKLPASRTKIYLSIDLVQLLPSSAIEILEGAIKTARLLDDTRALSFALGALGGVYERAGNRDLAINYTEEAILSAQQVFAVDSLYRWQWQAARLYQALGQTENAKNYYRQAIYTLQSQRGETITSSKQRRWDFRDRVEPVYRELIELLLASNQTQQIKEALNVFELLHLSELKNFFEDDCVEITKAISVNLQQHLRQTNAAAISSIVLKDKTYIILELPNGTIQLHSIAIKDRELYAQIEEWRELLTNVSTNRYLKLSRSLYDLLIRPFEKDLALSSPNTLIFVQDGILRNVPMAALHDGQQFLVEKYPIANSLGLNFITRQSIIKNSKLRVLAFGLSMAVGNFDRLPNVKQEVANVQSIIGGKQFLDEQFTVAKLQEQIQKSYPIVHLATHGRFDGTLENSFIQAFDRSISLQELESFLGNRPNAIDLLILSACETSIGDNRSVLGLAGVMIRSGTKTAIGSLWSVNDATTEELMTDFYKYLRQNNITKAEALRKAQLNQIADPKGHPSSWSDFILVGNWL